MAGYPRPASPMTAMDLLQKAHELDTQVLQIADNLPLERLTAAELDTLGSQAQKWGIILEAGTRGVRPKHLSLYLEIAARLHAPLLRTLLHGADGRPSIEEAEKDIRAVLPELREKNIVLAVENHDFYPVADLRGLMERIRDPYVGICLDPVNNLAQGDSTNDVFTTLGAYAANFHCKDYTIRRKPSNLGFDVEGCASGEGLLNLPRCIARFPDLSFLVELWTPWQDDIAATCALEDKWARGSVDALRRLRV